MPPVSVVNTPPSIITRSQTQRAQEFDQNRVSIPPSTPKSNRAHNSDTNSSILSHNSPQAQREQIRELVSAAVSAQQAEMLSNLTQHLSKVIETNIEAGLRRLSLSQPQPESSLNNNDPIENSNPRMRTLPSVEQQTLEQLLGLPSNSGPSPNGPRTSANLQTGNSFHSTESGVRPDKIGHIIHNWKIRFSGEPNGMSVDNFIYRVEALTTQTLEGNFDLLCRHISTLFDSKANDWFWRYHRSVKDIRWSELCCALRHQYRDSRTDVDYREMIRDRKQRPNESFDSFYEAIVEISDRLSTPLTEKVLVEILRRNLLPEIQHEILNLPIYSVSHLRDICRRREFFIADICRRQNISKPAFTRKQIHEISESESDILEEDSISAISLICWNCQKVGHRYQDCLEDRQVFCYGCGTPKVYKPNCTKCNSSKNLRFSALKSALKQTRTTSTSTD